MFINYCFIHFLNKQGKRLLNKQGKRLLDISAKFIPYFALYIYIYIHNELISVIT